MLKKYNSCCLAETLKFGQSLSYNLKQGSVIALKGALGSGKTTLVKGVALGLGVKEPVTSPTFSLIQEYAGRLDLYHIDLYRLKNKAETETLGLEEYIYGSGVTVIEWPEIILDILPKYTIYISIEVLNDNQRQFTITQEAVDDDSRN